MFSVFYDPFSGKEFTCASKKEIKEGLGYEKELKNLQEQIDNLREAIKNADPAPEYPQCSKMPYDDLEHWKFDIYKEDDSMLMELKKCYDIKDIHWDDHKQLNHIFATYFKFTDLEYFEKLENAWYVYKRCGYLYLEVLFDSLFGYGYLKKLSDEDRCVLRHYLWDHRRPFDYNINVVPPDPDANTGCVYYPVFSSAPMRAGE